MPSVAKTSAVTPSLQEGTPKPAATSSRPGPVVIETAGAATPVAAPPRAMQRELAEALAAGAFDPRADDVRWSPRRTLAFIVVTCSAFWIAVGLLVARVL